MGYTSARLGLALARSDNFCEQYIYPRVSATVSSIHLAHSHNNSLSMPATLPTRKIGTDSVTAIGFGAMGIAAFYGAADPDDVRLKVCPSHSLNEAYAHVTRSFWMISTKADASTGTLRMSIMIPRFFSVNGMLFQLSGDYMRFPTSVLGSGSKRLESAARYSSPPSLGSRPIRPSRSTVTRSMRSNALPPPLRGCNVSVSGLTHNDVAYHAPSGLRRFVVPAQVCRSYSKR